MANLIESTIWLLDETVYLVISLLDGLIAVVTFIPTMIDNLFFLMELLIAGIFSSIKLIVVSLWYSVSALLHMPSTVGTFIQSVYSGTRVCLNWSFEVLSLITSTLLSFGSHLFHLLKQIIIYIIENIGKFSYSVTFKPISAFAESLLYTISRTKDLCFRHTYNLLSLLHGRFSQILNSFGAIWNDVLSICLNLLNSLWNLPQTCFSKLSSFLQFSSRLDSMIFKHHTYSKYSEYLSYGTGWLNRFSQLMLTFSLLIFIAAVLVILYHMRFKVFGAAAKVLKFILRKMSQIFQLGQYAADRHNRGLALLPVEGHREEQDSNAVSDEEEDYDDRAVINRDAVQPERPVNGPRSGSTDRDMGPSRPSTSCAGRSPEQLLQEQIDKQLCVVCQDNEKDTVIFPCKHLCACGVCIEQITSSVVLDSRRCPLCRTKISSYLDVYT